jgi:hypothetical protein
MEEIHACLRMQVPMTSRSSGLLILGRCTIRRQVTRKRLRLPPYSSDAPSTFVIRTQPENSVNSQLPLGRLELNAESRVFS